MHEMHYRKNKAKSIKYESDLSIEATSRTTSSINDIHIFVGLLSLRILNIFFVQTWFVPDEYWQSLEVAHNQVFGYGYLTWEWKVGVRSYLHPLLFACLYILMDFVGLSYHPTVIIYAPRVLEAVITAFAECCFYKFVKQNFGEEIAFWTSISLLLSWFWWYCCTRTLINSIEASLVCISLFTYPWTSSNCHINRQFSAFIFTACITTILRPTSVTIWIPLFSLYLYKIYLLKSFKIVIFRATGIAIFALTLLFMSLVIDRICYGRWLSVHFNFLQFNLLNNQGTFYGDHPWHWYVTQGLPVVAGTHLPLILHCIWSYQQNSTLRTYKATSICSVSLFIIFFTILIYSIPGHKEFRFILSLLPFLSLFSGLSVSSLSKRNKRFAVMWLILTNVPIALYTGLIHQSGPSKVMEYLRTDLHKDISVLTLMPCHSTPYYAFIHSNISMRFLTCEPDFKRQGRSYLDEADLFYLSPSEWVRDYLFTNTTDNRLLCSNNAATRIVLYDKLYEELHHLLSKCYKTCYQTFHTHLPEGRVGSSMLVLCKI